MDDKPLSDAQRLENDCKLMLLALEEARRCVPREGAFSVGCVIAENGDPDRILSTGYSREMPGNTHAEECALNKIEAVHVTQEQQIHLYTTMEPCSVRLSGNKPCVERILASGIIKRVIQGLREPDDFVKCEGTQILEEAGIEVSHVYEYEKECLEVARRPH